MPINYDKTTKSINYNIADNLKPTISDIINLGKIYNFSGLGGIAVFSSTMLADKILASQGVERKYISNSAFWGYIAYKSIQQINESKIIDTKYKILLNLFFATGAVALTKYGKDIFSTNYDITKLGGSVKLVADFFDKDKVISGLVDSYNKSYIEATKYIFNNYRALATNKFILHILASQVLEVGNTVITQKLLPEKVFDQLSTFLALKGNDAVKDISKLLLANFANKLANLGYQKIQGTLTNYIKKEIDLQIANLAFDDSNREKVIKIDNINLISDKLNQVTQRIDNDFSAINNSLTLPLITTGNLKISGSIEEFLNQYASFIFLNEFKQFIFSSLNRDNIIQYLQKILLKQESNENPYNDCVQTQMENVKLNIVQTPQNYAYPNIQEITKIGANKFILNKLTEYINYTALNQSSHINECFIGNNFNFFVNAFYTLAYVIQIIAKA